jgi:hypothetical protein
MGICESEIIKTKKAINENEHKKHYKNENNSSSKKKKHNKNYSNNFNTPTYLTDKNKPNLKNENSTEYSTSVNQNQKIINRNSNKENLKIESKTQTNSPKNHLNKNNNPNKNNNNNNINININKRNSHNNNIKQSNSEFQKKIYFENSNHNHISKTKSNNIIKSSINKNVNLTINEESSIENNYSNNQITNSINQNNEYEFPLEATIGEVEIPIYLKKGQTFEILILDENEKWSFFPDEEKITISGYEFKEYNKFKIGSLLYRISSSSEFHSVNLKNKKKIAESDGTLLLSANLDPYETDYEPEGKIHLKICGGEKYENFNKVDELNGFKLKNTRDNNYNIINNKKEINTIRYINLVRVNPKNFCSYYLFNLKDNQKKNLLNEVTSIHELIIDLNLSRIAIQMAEEIANEDTTGHLNNNELSMKMQQNKISFKSFSENILYGNDNPLLIVSKMLVDNNPHNRFNILDNRFTHIGIGIRKHMVYKWICVIIFVELMN